MSEPLVEITENGRSGSIYYREGSNTVRFYWEFAASPALALVFGDGAKDWALRHPWAADRQAAIYDFVGGEIVRQKAPRARCKIDLDGGFITVG
jgi:hypothetical protein